MNTTAITTTVSKTLHKTGFKIKKYSPEILAVTGVIGIVTSAVMACKATTKVSAILEESKHNIDVIHECVENPKLVESGKYTEEDAKKDLTITYVQTGIKLVKLYAPSVILGTLSITSMLASNNILRKRNAALAAAYATIDKSFKKYRERVIERFGETVDKELKYGVKKQKVEEIVTDPETGKEKKVKKTVDVADDLDGYSEYARFFDDGCKGWEKNAEANLAFLRAQQQYANDLLRARGYLFLNEVYNNLGIPISKAGQVVGWVYDPDNADLQNYVDFGIYDVSKPKARDFVNGYERSILLDFNVDGDIWSLMN